MIKNIVKDTFFLSLPSKEASREDENIIQDLKDTLRFHSSHCLGMAANMIGVNKRIIAINLGANIIVMINPIIVNKTGLYKSEEGCLSLKGVKPCERYKRIVVEFYDEGFKKQVKEFSLLPAQIIQHEIDHLSGILI